MKNSAWYFFSLALIFSGFVCAGTNDKSLGGIKEIHVSNNPIIDALYGEIDFKEFKDIVFKNLELTLEADEHGCKPEEVVAKHGTLYQLIFARAQVLAKAAQSSNQLTQRLGEKTDPQQLVALIREHIDKIDEVDQFGNKPIDVATELGKYQAVKLLEKYRKNDR